jgi:HK97 family phage portal protein
MKWPWQPKALTATAEVQGAFLEGFNPLPRLGGGSTQRIVEAFQTAKTANYAWLYRKSPAVRSVIDCVVRNVGQLDLRLYEEVDDAERQPQYDHPAALSMRYPSETVPADQFIRTMFRDYLIAADAVALMLPGTGNQVRFKWIPISLVQFLSSQMFDAETYRIHNQLQGTYVDFPADRILHWRGEHPEDPRVGLSHLETLRDLIAEDVAMQQANVELAQSGMTEATWVYRPVDAPPWSNPARDGFEEHLTNRIKRGRKQPVVLEEGMELRPMGVSPKDAQALDLRRWIKGQVADEYGVPRAMVGLDGDIEQARSMFYTDTLPPYCEEFTKFLNLRICVRVYSNTDLCFEFNLDEKHMGDDRLTALTSASGRPVLLTNEARARLNLPPVDTGDELITPLNVIVGDNPKPSTDVMPIQDPNKPPQDGSYREEPKAIGWKQHLIDAKAVDDPTAQSHEDFQPVPQLHPGFKRDLEIQHQAVDLAKAAIQRHFNRLERARRQKAADLDWDALEIVLSKDIYKTVRSVVGGEGPRYAFKLGGQFDMNRVRNYLRAMAEGAAEAINDTTRQEVHDLGFDDALAKAPQHVASAGAGIGTAATRWSREEAARQSPDTEHRMKTWIPNTQRHAEFAGDTVPLGDDWPAGFAPGSAPGCGCTLAIS